jgi:hypothetical protein
LALKKGHGEISGFHWVRRKGFIFGIKGEIHISRTFPLLKGGNFQFFRSLNGYNWRLKRGTVKFHGAPVRIKVEEYYKSLFTELSMDCLHLKNHLIKPPTH